MSSSTWISRILRLVRHQVIPLILLMAGQHPSILTPCWSLAAPSAPAERRAFLQDLLSVSGSTAAAATFTASFPQPSLAASAAQDDSSTSLPSLPFETTAYGRQEYTNSITASRDTNLSPAEAYDVIRQRIPPASSLSSSSSSSSNTNDSSDSPPRALDLGAGAGLSTAILCNEKGYAVTDAVDWSRTAWDASVTRQPETVRFHEMDDTAFFEHALQQQQQQQQPPNRYYDVIVYNFACNFDKAVYAATTFLKPDSDTAVLLAPVNDRRDYWYKQTYVVLDSRGRIVWKSEPEVGAWSVQFQPDVTSPTCTGIWCGGFNGYQAKRR